MENIELCIHILHTARVHKNSPVLLSNVYNKLQLTHVNVFAFCRLMGA